MLRPGAAMPTYVRGCPSFVCLSGSVSAKNDVARLGPGGGNTRTSLRAKRARTWACALRTVAVDATIFGRTTFPSMVRVESASMAVS